MATTLREMKHKAMETVLRGISGIADATVSFTDVMISIRYDPETIERKQVYLVAKHFPTGMNIISKLYVGIPAE